MGDVGIDPGGNVENSRVNLDGHIGGVPETAIVIRSDGEVENHSSVSENNGDSNAENLKVFGDEELKINGQKNEKHSCVIDVKCGKIGENLNLNLDGERVCRICQLSTSDQSEDNNNNNNNNNNDNNNNNNNGKKVLDLMELGCGCKNELGIAHSHCAEAWFKLKRNRLCEICGETAKNVTGIGDNRFMQELIGSSGTNSSDRSGRCWHRQPLWNFLMACLVIAFVLPWFFRVNMF